MHALLLHSISDNGHCCPRRNNLSVYSDENSTLLHCSRDTSSPPIQNPLHVNPTDGSVCSQELRSTIALLLCREVSVRPSPQSLLDLPCVRQHAAQLCIRLDDGASLSQARTCPPRDSCGQASPNCRDGPQTKQNNLRKPKVISPLKSQQSARSLGPKANKGIVRDGLLLWHMRYLYAT